MRVNPVHYHHQEADVQRTLRLGFSLSNPSLLMNCLRFAWQQYFMMRKTQSLWDHFVYLHQTSLNRHALDNVWLQL